MRAPARADAYAWQRTMAGVEYAKGRRKGKHWICKPAAAIIRRWICKVVGVPVSCGRGLGCLVIEDNEEGPVNGGARSRRKHTHWKNEEAS